VAEVAALEFKEHETVADAIDRLLYAATGAWEELPEVDAEFSTWTPGEREDYLIEWNLEEGRLRELAGLEAEMTREQHTRYDKLLETVKQNRPIITRLLGPVVNMAESRKEAGLPPIPGS
jgi:hypothetical protein